MAAEHVVDVFTRRAKTENGNFQTGARRPADFMVWYYSGRSEIRPKALVISSSNP